MAGVPRWNLTRSRSASAFANGAIDGLLSAEPFPPPAQPVSRGWKCRTYLGAGRALGFCEPTAPGLANPYRAEVPGRAARGRPRELHARIVAQARAGRPRRRGG